MNDLTPKKDYTLIEDAIASIIELKEDEKIDDFIIHKRETPSSCGFICRAKNRIWISYEYGGYENWASFRIIKKQK